MCNTVSTSMWQVLKKWITHRWDRSRVWRRQRWRATGRDATVTPPLCRESQGYKQVLLMYTGRFTPDSPLYLTDFHIVTNCVWVCVVWGCVWMCVCSFLLSCHSSICYLLVFLCITGKSLIFVLSLWRWMIFDLSNYTFGGFCLTT